MKFEALKRRVDRAEQLVDGRIAQTLEHHGCLGREWRRAWTPGRIVVAGLASGFIAGRTRALHTLGALGGAAGRTRWLQLASSLSGLVASLRAAMASMAAEVAANTSAAEAGVAADAAQDAAETVEDSIAPRTAHAAPDAAPRPASDRRRPDPALEREPQAASAATEVSER